MNQIVCFINCLAYRNISNFSNLVVGLVQKFSIEILKKLASYLENTMDDFFKCNFKGYFKLFWLPKKCL